MPLAPALTESMDQWLDDLAERQVSQHTVTNYRSALHQFKDWLGKRSGTQELSSLRVHTFVSYIKTLQARHLAQTTLHAHIGVLTRWLHDLVDYGHLMGGIPNRLERMVTPDGVRDTLERLVGPKPPLVAPRVPDLRELPNYYGDCVQHWLQAREGMLPSLKDHIANREYLSLLRNQALIGALFSSGGRIHEVLSLQVAQVHRRGRVVDAPVIAGKGRKQRPLRLDADARSWIGDYLTARRPYFAAAPAVFISHGPRGVGQQLSTVTGWRVVKNAADALADQRMIEGASREEIQDLRDVSPHSIRHYMAQAMLDEGAEYKDIAALFGHSSTSVTEQVYAQLSPDRVLEIADTFAPRRARRRTSAPRTNRNDGE